MKYLKIILNVIILISLSSLITWGVAMQMLEPIRLGDVNNDGRIDETDLKLVQNHLLEKHILNKDEILRADMDQNGEITVYDLLRVQRYITGGR